MIITTRRTLLAGAAALAAVPASAQSRLSDVIDVTQEIALDDRVARGYHRDVLIRWGDAVAFDAPPWNPDVPGEAAARGQFAWDAVTVGIVSPPPAADGVARLVLVVAHPDAEPAMMFPAMRSMPEVEIASVGASVINLVAQGGRWVIARGGFQQRRLTATTLCRVGGPLAGHVRQRTAEDPAGAAVRGIIAPTAGTPTPWRTMLLGEGDAAPALSRWRSLGGRFADPNEEMRFGWVVELDPLEPTYVPSKRTALGRFPRSGLATALAADGRLVVYMSEGRADGYLYRFVSARPVDATDRAANDGLLDEGTLSVAGVGPRRIEWRALPSTPEALLDLRAAATAAGGSVFDAPAGLAVHPDGRVFLACRGNPSRGAARTNIVNPRAVNTWGHVAEITPAGGDHAAAEAEATVLILGGDLAAPATTARYGPGTRAWLAAPESLAVDQRGRLWIGTAQGNATPGLQRATNIADGVFVCGTASGAQRGVVQAIYAAPRGARMGGVALTPDGSTLITAVRTPGFEQGADFTRPATRWPDLDPNRPPRSTVIALSRDRGGPFGG
ncbi:PhoX family phosphatase [Elioraea sp.]|uniref:PhoX family protein n=1 Tax=Elioraea sp. TaxID=2185103 RepID=UPI0025C279F9|nr:alkaline phosphatase PhoX [Elioraea sp.]